MFDRCGRISALALIAMVPVGGAHAGGFYVSASGGVSLAEDSDNAGVFDGDFNTGAGTTVPAGAVLPDGTDVGWTTEFDTGFAASATIGQRRGPFRTEIEFAYQSNDVDTHRDVVAGGIDLSNEDAGVLVTGADNLGVTVADLVADGQGDIETIFLMGNVFYDVDIGGPLKPYIGGGVGVGFVDVAYTPSATEIINDDATAFAYQVAAGVAWEVSPTTELFAGYATAAPATSKLRPACSPPTLISKTARRLSKPACASRFNGGNGAARHCAPRRQQDRLTLMGG